MVTAVQSLLADAILAKMDAGESYWSYKSGSATPSLQEAIKAGAIAASTTEKEWSALSPGMRREIARSVRSDAPGDVRIVHNKLLGGWYVVRGSSDTPLSGRFPSKEAAQQWLIDRKNKRDDSAGLIKFEARIYEKAEHWTFDTTVDAKDEADAHRLLKKDYPKSEYTIQSVRRA